MIKDFVLAGYRSMHDSETEADLLVNDDAKVITKLIGVNGGDVELRASHDALLSESGIEGVIVLHYDSLKALFNTLMGGSMSEVIDFKSASGVDDLPFTDDELRLANIYDIAVGLIIDIEEGRIFSMAEIKAQMIEVLEIIQEEL